MNNLDCLLLLPLGRIRRNLIEFSGKSLLHITTVTRKENLINLLKIFPKNPKNKTSKIAKYFSQGKCFNCGKS
jgi:lauroyl/myristoyl acyltransferase